MTLFFFCPRQVLKLKDTFYCRLFINKFTNFYLAYSLKGHI